jgi:hypothetical protein
VSYVANPFCEVRNQPVKILHRMLRRTHLSSFSRLLPPLPLSARWGLSLMALAAASRPAGIFPPQREVTDPGNVRDAGVRPPRRQASRALVLRHRSELIPRGPAADSFI